MRLRLNFRGEVQGVGFRATAERLARGFPISGFVRNEADGSVWLEAQGEVDALDRFLAALHRSPVGRGVHEEQRTLASPVAGEDGFEIRRA